MISTSQTYSVMQWVGEGMDRAESKFPKELVELLGNCLPSNEEEDAAWTRALKEAGIEATDEMLLVPVYSSDIIRIAAENYKEWRDNPKRGLYVVHGKQPGEAPRGESDSLQPGN